MENTKSIGICPICGKGHITEHPFGWACDNSKVRTLMGHGTTVSSWCSDSITEH